MRFARSSQKHETSATLGSWRDSTQLRWVSFSHAFAFSNLLEISLCVCLLETSGRQRPVWRRIGCSHANSELTSRFHAEIYVGKVCLRYEMSMLAKKCCFLWEPYSFGPRNISAYCFNGTSSNKSTGNISGGLSSNLRYHPITHTSLRKTSFFRNHKTPIVFALC